MTINPAKVSSIADLDFALINERKQLMDSVGHYSRREVLSLRIDRTGAAHVHQCMTEPETLSAPAVAK